MDPRRGKLSITNSGSEIDYVLIFGKDFKEILSTYTGLTERPPLLPRWAFGLWVTSFPQEDQTRTITFLKEHRKRHIPLDAIILDYHGRKNSIILDGARNYFLRPIFLSRTSKRWTFTWA